MREINSARTIAPRFFFKSRWYHAVERRTRGNQRTALRRIFDSPGFAAIKAPREQMFLGASAINVVAFPEVPVKAATEADEDFIAPGPEAVIRRPAPKATRLGINLEVANCVHIRIRAQRCGREGKRHAQK